MWISDELDTAGRGVSTTGRAVSCGVKNPSKKVTLTLVGLDGNAFSLLAAFRSQARREGWKASEIEEVTEQATAGDYGHHLSVISGRCKGAGG
jgi:hypothetical protein